MSRLFRIFALGILLASCSDSAGPSSSPSGNWAGFADGEAVAFALDENGGVVSGAGTWLGDPFVVTGNFNAPNVSLQFRFPEEPQPISFTGLLVNDKLTGTMFYAGYGNFSAQFDRLR